MCILAPRKGCALRHPKGVRLGGRERKRQKTDQKSGASGSVTANEIGDRQARDEQYIKERTGELRSHSPVGRYPGGVAVNVVRPSFRIGASILAPSSTEPQRL